jgi:hypothetical protein
MLHLYKASELLELSTLETKSYSTGGIIESDLKRATRILNENVKAYSAYRTYDIFLSHSIKDARIILGLKKDLENRGLKVYVDWIEDSQLDRSKVTPENADIIRTRIKSCRCLFYAISKESRLSSWVQWELGYADGNRNGKVAILPIETDSNDNDFYTQEYLGLYPVVDHGREKERLWINRGKEYHNYWRWIEGENV